MLKSLHVVAPMVGAAGISIALSVSAHADVDLVASDDPLSDSTNAIILGGTGEPTPSTDYVDAAESLYLQPLGFSDAGTICDMVATAPCDAPLQVLTTPELFEFGPSSLQDETDIISAVEAEFHEEQSIQSEFSQFFDSLKGTHFFRLKVLIEIRPGIQIDVSQPKTGSVRKAKKIRRTTVRSYCHIPSKTQR